MFDRRTCINAVDAHPARATAYLLLLVLLLCILPAHASQNIRKGMTWTVLGHHDGHTHLGSDSLTNPYAGDSTIDQFLPILCLRVDGRAPPGGVLFDFYNGWAQGEARLTPPIAATVLTSRAQGDEICSETFGDGWRLAEFHDGFYPMQLDPWSPGGGLEEILPPEEPGGTFWMPGGWSFWAAGHLPAGQRFWVAIEDQPANPWDSAGEIPAVQMPKFVPSDAPVPNQYLALLPEGTPESSVEGLAQQLLSAHGGTMIDLFPAVLGFSFNASEAQARAMSADPRVESVDQDSYAEAQIEWHQDRVDSRIRAFDWIFTPPNDGAGVNIYILDTGFRRSHVEFGGRATQEADFIRFLGTRDDCNGHGTAVGSAAAGANSGIARGANLISVRIAGCRGTAYNPLVSVTSSTIVAGLDWVARFHRKPAVANVSYGASPGFWRRWFNLRTPMDRAVRRAVNAGVTVIAAAGNENKNANRSSPARAPEAISVSATDINDNRASFGNFGKVEIFAPGVSLYLADFSGDGSYRTMSGTSFSAPLVAGAAAVFLRNNPAASPADVRNALLNSATPNVVGNPGPGSANRLLYVGTAGNATHAGMTWRVLEQRSGHVLVGSDASTNPYVGDISPSASLPVLCLFINNAAVPAGVFPDFYAGWARGTVAATLPVPGSQLASPAVADALCASSFGPGWRMAEFHDGRYGTGLAFSGGWAFWANGLLPTATRFWVRINDQPANPWD
jgi:subtilisin family serine protease